MRDLRSIGRGEVARSFGNDRFFDARERGLFRVLAPTIPVAARLPPFRHPPAAPLRLSLSNF